MFYDEKVVNIRRTVSTAPVEQEININDLFFRKIISLLKEEDKVLDIGTGNGFVLKQLYERVNFSCSLYGIDNSDAMINEATKNLSGKANIFKGENDDLPFEDSFFDIVTAKNVTQFNAYEIFRVLKNHGFFILREYGKGKGLIEIANLFKNRMIRSRDPLFYVEELEKAKMHKVYLEKYCITKTFRNIEDLLNVTKSYPFIDSYSIDDEIIIRNEFANKNIKITSDPFILIAQKL